MQSENEVTIYGQSLNHWMQVAEQRAASQVNQYPAQQGLQQQLAEHSSPQYTPPIAVDLQRIAALEARVSLLLEQVAELKLYVAREQERARPTPIPDAAFPERVLKWSV
jgi:hypothetical protein